MLSIEFNKNSKKAFKKYLHDLEKDIEVYTRAEIEDSMLWIEEQAAISVPVDTGNLKNSIQSKPLKVKNGSIEGGVEVGGNYTSEGGVEVGANYAPYVEFGTGTAVNVPSELSDFAKQFKGKGLKKVNLLARPFFYPAVFKMKTELPKRIEKRLKNLLK